MLGFPLACQAHGGPGLSVDYPFEVWRLGGGALGKRELLSITPVLDNAWTRGSTLGSLGSLGTGRWALGAGHWGLGGVRRTAE